ncbi:MAG: adenylate/guanylate cyclase domain-containing protein [Microcoleus vaginatus WJT46-NPBG5]|jgi:class 3 adenylate cyclase|nr:adenylate/guanylate cyclase domain-containing protein [Microcoleus vaginatus WJT46-NPBG5]
MKQKFVGKTWLETRVRNILTPLLWTQSVSSAGDYETWRHNFMQNRLRLGLWIAFTSFLTFTGLEVRNFLFKGQFNSTWVVTQVSVELSLLVCFALLRSPLGKKYPGLAFLIFSWSVTLSPQIRGTFSGVLEPSILVWPLMFFGQATLMPVHWRLHLISQLGVLVYCAGTTAALNLQVKMPAPWMTPAVLYLYMFWICFICVLSVYLYERVQRAEFNARQELELAYEKLKAEQERSERLLLNVLPESIAIRLKQDHQTIAESFTDVTVLFADIVGFTELSSQISPPELVELLNQIFSAFDQLAEDHGLEKIKTIGDAYMVVAGLPLPRKDHAQAIANMALDMQRELAKFNTRTGQSCRIRIGISTGPVVAGVIGIKKFIYDLWGDTVNMASRMESQGIAGCIQVTHSTYDCLKDRYQFEERGSIHVKGKGEMKTYFLIGKK